MLGKIQRGTLEPMRAGHFHRGEHARRGRMKTDVIEFRDGTPERSRLVRGPCPQRRVIGKLQATLFLEPVQITRQVRPRNGFGCRLPKGLDAR